MSGRGDERAEGVAVAGAGAGVEGAGTDADAGAEIRGEDIERSCLLSSRSTLELML
jgi:hypothetical protein